VEGLVFVTDGDERATLAVVRALGRAGIAVTVGNSQLGSLAGSSRYCARRVRYPSPLSDAPGFKQFLREEMRKGYYRVLLPMTDIATSLAAEVSTAISPFVALPIPGGKQIGLAQDKGEILMLAQKLGIPCPKTVCVADAEDVGGISRELAYPVVIKPRCSRFQRNGSWVAGGVEYAFDDQDLSSKWQRSHARIPNPLIQEKLNGEGRGVFLFVWNGDLKAAFCHRRLREKPPSGGVSVYRESIPIDDDLVDKSFSLLKALGWNGVAMVEFKVDSRDRIPKLMEVNGRFWGSLQLAIDAGMNFPVLLYRAACGEQVPPQFDYKAGVKSRWLLGDLDHLLIRLTHPAAENGFSAGAQASKLKACLNFLKFYEPDLHYEVLRFDDPSPGWIEFKSYVRQNLQSLGGQKKVSHAD
jgi:predicted ATP-grasp superfamily ATP-dependent carboligase